MIEEIYESFKKEAFYGKVKSSLVLSYLSYFLVATIIVAPWLNFHFDKANNLIIDDSIRTVVFKFFISAILAIIISRLLLNVIYFCDFKSKGIKEKLMLVLKGKFIKEYKNYFLENDRMVLKKILADYNVSSPIEIEFIIKRYESMQFIKKTNPAILISIVSLLISTIAFIFGNQIEDIDLRATIIFFIILVVFFVPVVKSSFSDFTRDNIMKYRFKEYYVALLTDEFFNIDSGRESLISTEYFKYIVTFNNKKYFLKSIKQISIMFGIESIHRLYKELRQKQKIVIFNDKERTFFIERI